MQSFYGSLSPYVPNYFQHCVLLHPSYFPPQIPLFPITPPLQTEIRQKSPDLLPSMSINVSGNTDEAILTEVLETQPPKKVKKQKTVVSDREQEEDDEQYKIRQGKAISGSSFSYKKKNTESNIVNQAFSFLCSDKSETFVKTFFKGLPDKIQQYYRVMTKVKQGNKKYINRIYLRRLMVFKEKSEFERAFIKAKAADLTITQMRKALRTLLFCFLREQINLSMLTSCKIYKETLPEHFWRRRQILKYLFVESSKGEP